MVGKLRFAMSKAKLSLPLLIHLLPAVLFFATSCKANECLPSSCGDIRNISYPFRLEGDPKKCGDSSYELGCENNRTILKLNSGNYFVRAIDYEKYSIRIVDPGLHKASCSSFPSNILDEDDIPIAYRFSLFTLNTPVAFIDCAARAKSPFYIDTTVCSKYSPSNSSSPPHNYSYIVVGDSDVSFLEDSCSLSQLAWISADVYERPNYTILSEVQDALAHGFVLQVADQCSFNHSFSVHEFRQILKCLYQVVYMFLTLPITFLHREWRIDEFIGIGIGFCFAGRFSLGVLLLLALIIYKIRRSHLSMYENIEDFLQGPNNLMPVRYSYSAIRKMTNNFSDKLGEGGFGAVFKGKLRSGPLVAVKMLGKSNASGQEFISEVATIGMIHHVNVVKLTGFCFEGSKRALVYDFMPNGSLEKYIFSHESKTISLSCEKMFEIALGVARGIDYLHRGCHMQILHFDIKPHNILLDENFCPKVSDFGLAKLYPAENSIVTLTAARGTLGYMAPELFYKNIGGVSFKADIYSFGMLLMEMAGKRKNLNPFVDHLSQIYFPSWVYDQLHEGKDIEIADASEDEKKLVKKMILVALWCIQMRPANRPSMSKVIEMLEGDPELLEMPPKPFQSPQEMPAQEDSIGADII